MDNYYKVINNKGKLEGYISKKNFSKTKNLESKTKKQNDLMEIRNNNISNNINYSYNKKMIKEFDFNTGIVIANNIKYQIEDFEKVKKHIRINTRKLFMYAIYKLNTKTNISEFTLKDYAETCNKKDRKELAKKIKSTPNKPGDLEMLRKITNISCINGEYQEFLGVITKTKYNRGKIKIYFDPEFAESLKYFMFIPRIMFSINDKKYPHAYVLTYFFFEHARIKKMCNFKLKISTCLERTTIPTKEEITNRHYSKRMIEPFLNTIDYISEKIEIIKITPEGNYDNINEFLEGYIKIKIKNNKIVDHYKEKENKRKKHEIQKNKTGKEERIEQAKKLLNEGKTNKEISEILNVQIRTIKNYIKEIKKR